MNLNCRPNLVSRGKLKYDSVRGTDFLLLPERAVKLNKTGALILSMCDGTRTINDIVSKLKSEFRSGKIHDDVVAFLNRVYDYGWLRMDGN